MPDNIVGLMAKFPEPGLVKTRIAKETSDQYALTIYKSLLSNVINNCQADSTNSYELACFISPAEKLDQFRDQYDKFSYYLSQVGDDLGQRMQIAISELFKQFNANKVILIGADIPNLTSVHLQKTFDLLDKNDIVYGPTHDGGYYLIGQKKPNPELFENVDWGTELVLQQSLEIADKAQLKVALLEKLSDLDHLADLKLFPQFLASLSDAN